MTLSLARQVNAIRCTVGAHAWVLQQLRRGPWRVEVCSRCGAIEKYYDVIKELTG
jgi:hypothetical protein